VVETIDEEFSKDSKPVKKLIKEQRVSVEDTSEAAMNAKTLILDKRQKSLVQTYAAEEKVPVRVAPSYARYFGRVMRVSINGISVAVKCDGQTVNLPASYAAEVLRRMSEMDKYELRLSKMSNVTKNFEASPGQLNFFG
jgi:hypothetical protein